VESAQIQALHEPPLAAMPQLSEKPRQGFETNKQAWNRGPNVCNFTVTLGLRATVVENGVRETYSARFYNPATGRFMSRDPEDGKAKDPASLHKYLYAGGDPVNGVDPTGRTTYTNPNQRTAGGALADYLSAVNMAITQVYVYTRYILPQYVAQIIGVALLGGTLAEVANWTLECIGNYVETVASVTEPTLNPKNPAACHINVHTPEE
jgi:RHS repeat-associated protein